jgi:hypothetical protein
MKQIAGCEREDQGHRARRGMVIVGKSRIVMALNQSSMSMRSWCEQIRGVAGTNFPAGRGAR